MAGNGNGNGITWKWMARGAFLIAGVLISVVYASDKAQIKKNTEDIQTVAQKLDSVLVVQGQQSIRDSFFRANVINTLEAISKAVNAKPDSADTGR